MTLIANPKTTVDELNEAIEILKSECSTHTWCEDCVFGSEGKCQFIQIPPEDWKTINGDEQDELAGTNKPVNTENE